MKNRISVIASVAFLALAVGCASPSEDRVDVVSDSINASDTSGEARPFARGAGAAELAASLIGSFEGEPPHDELDGTIFGSIVLRADGSFQATAGVPSDFYREDRSDERGRWGVEAFTVTYGSQSYDRFALVLLTDHGKLRYEFNKIPPADGSSFVINDVRVRVQQNFYRTSVETSSGTVESDEDRPFTRGDGAEELVSLLSGSFVGEPKRHKLDGTIFGSIVLRADGSFQATAGEPSDFYREDRSDEQGRWGIEAFTVTYGSQSYDRFALILLTDHGELRYAFNEIPAADGSNFVINDDEVRVQQRFHRTATP